MSRSHLLSNTPTYYSWQSMKDRCKNPKNSRYHQYGGRGISYPDKWETFEGFLEDMGAKPSGRRYSIDRIDCNKSYSIENCRWATDIDQQNNKRNNRYIEFLGSKRTLQEWQRETGIYSSVIARRLNRGWSVEKSLTEPVIMGRRRKENV